MSDKIMTHEHTHTYVHKCTNTLYELQLWLWELLALEGTFYVGEYYIQDQRLEVALDNYVDSQVSAQKPDGVNNMHYKGNYYNSN